MNTTALFVSILAGLSTCLGYFIIYIKGEESNIVASSLSLALGVMLSLSLMELMPMALSYLKLSFYSIFSYLFWILFFIIGFLLSMSSELIKNNNQLYRLGIISFLILFMHNIPEGIITYITSDIDISNGILLALSISLHNIPEGITISIPIYYATKSKIKTFILIFIVSLSELIGSIMGILFLNNISNTLIGLMYAVISGLMVGICCFELLPEIQYYQYSKSKVYIILGIVLIIITHLLF